MTLLWLLPALVWFSSRCGRCPQRTIFPLLGCACLITPVNVPAIPDNSVSSLYGTRLWRGLPNRCGRCPHRATFWVYIYKRVSGGLANCHISYEYARSTG